MNTFINAISMDGTKLKLITPINIRRTILDDGSEHLLVGYLDPSGTIHYLPMSFLLMIQYLKGQKSGSSTIYLSFSDPSNTRSVIEPNIMTRTVDPLNYTAGDAAFQTSISDQLQTNHISDLLRTTMDTAPAYNILDTTLHANPHLDKTLLTPRELQEVMLWALSVANGDSWPNHLTNNDVISTSPNTALEKLSAFLATLVYGENNYIGPGKTGDLGPQTLEKTVATAPALSDADARARAHDIALEVTSSPEVDKILPPIAQAAQVFRPYFIQPPQQRSTGATNYSLLKLSGNVEENPGPPKRYGTEAANEESEIYATPNRNNDIMNIQYRNFPDYWRSVYETGPNYYRGNADNQTDVSRADDGLTNFCGIDLNNVPTLGNRAWYNLDDLYTYSVRAQNPKTAQMSYGKLGAALSATLSAFPDYLSLQRTNTNSIAGNPDLNIFTRAGATDFGCWLPLAKMLLYEMLSGPLSGSDTLRICDNVMTKHSGAAIASPTIWPNTTNVLAGGLPPVNAWAITTEVLNALLLGNIPAPPAGFPGLNNANTAYVVISDETTPSTVSYASICHMEWPMTSETVRVFTDNLDPAGFSRLQSVTGMPDYRSRTLIEGPKDSVIFIITTTSEVADIQVDDGNGVFTGVTIWDDPNAPPPAVNIAAELFSYANVRLAGGNVMNFSDGFHDALGYMLRFADKHDWDAAMSFAGTVMYNVGNFNRTKWTNTVANSGRWCINRFNPTLNAVVAGTVALDDTAGNWNPIRLNFTRAWPCLNDRLMMPNYSAIGAGGVARPPAARNAWLEDSPWLTKYAIYKGFFAKDLLSPHDVNDFVRLGIVGLWHAIRRGTLLRCECAHNLMQDMGYTNRNYMLWQNEIVQNNRVLQHDNCEGQGDYAAMVAGWHWITILTTNRPIGQPGTPIQKPTLLGLSYDWLYDSPLYVHNPLTLVERTSLGIYPLGSTGYNLSALHKQWEPAATNAITIYGVGVGDQASLVTVPGKTSDGEYPTEIRQMYAVTKMQLMTNANPALWIPAVYLVRWKDNNRTPFVVRAPTISTITAGARWVYDDASQAQFLDQTRYTFISLPFYPPLMDYLTGYEYAVGITNVGVLNSNYPGLNVSGLGSSTYATITIPSARLGGLRGFGKKAIESAPDKGGDQKNM